MQNSGSFVLGTQQLHFTSNTDDTTALSTQDVHCAFTALPKVSHAFDFRETNTTKYHLYYFCLLNHVHGISENYTILPAELEAYRIECNNMSIWTHWLKANQELQNTNAQLCLQVTAQGMQNEHGLHTLGVRGHFIPELCWMPFPGEILSSLYLHKSKSYFLNQKDSILVPLMWWNRDVCCSQSVFADKSVKETNKMLMRFCFQCLLGSGKPKKLTVTMSHKGTSLCNKLAEDFIRIYIRKCLKCSSALNPPYTVIWWDLPQGAVLL